MRSANTAARFVLIVCAIIAASCHHDLTSVGSVATVSVSPNTVSLLVGDTITITPSEQDVNGLIITGVGVTWISSDTTIATVSGAGLVTAKKLGKVTVTATAGSASGLVNVTVVAALPPSISSITVSPTPAFVVVRGTQQLTATVRDSVGNAIPGLTVTWQSNNPPVATVSATGLVTGVTVGAAIITASIGGFLGTSTVTVQTSIVLGPSSVVVAPATATVGIGRTQLFAATATDSSGNTFPNTTAKWVSSNPAVATVDSTGLATGVSSGTVTISATAFGGTGTATLTVQVLHLVAVSAGDLYSCGLQADGSTWCWGGDQGNQLGDSTTTNSSAPVATKGGFHFVALSAGYAHSCALTATSAAYCWGDNTHGELGDGTMTHRPVPVAVSGGLQFSSVTTGLDHSCGLTAAGVAWCWGNNDAGQLGNGSNSAATTPVAASGGIAFATISAGYQNTCGIATSGAAYCWGDNTLGQIGDGTMNATAIPVAVASGTNFVSISSGFWHSCGVTSAGAALCWGNNDQGQLGTGDMQSHALPVPVLGGITFATVGAGGGDALQSYSCGLDTSGSAWCWGDNIWGELGNGATSPFPALFQARRWPAVFSSSRSAPATTTRARWRSGTWRIAGVTTRRGRSATAPRI